MTTAEDELMRIIAAVERLIKEWREAAACEFDHGNQYYAQGVDMCADRLESLMDEI